MLPVIGFLVIAAVVGVILFVTFSRDKAKKQPARTVRCPPSETTVESEARYRSVTHTVGDDAQGEKN